MNLDLQTWTGRTDFTEQKIDKSSFMLHFRVSPNFIVLCFRRIQVMVDDVSSSSRMPACYRMLMFPSVECQQSVMSDGKEPSLFVDEYSTIDSSITSTT